MDTLPTTRKSIEKKELLYSQVIAAALISYAEKDKDFVQSFAELISSSIYSKKSDVVSRFIPGIEFVMPLNREQAIRKVEWLIQEIKKERIPGYREASALFSQWERVRTIESPKQIVVGLIRVAIPGITLGRLKMRSRMHVVISDQMMSAFPIDLARKISSVNTTILSRAFQMAGDDIQKLEPEIADWFYGEKESVFYRATEEKMYSIQTNLDRLDILHEVAYQDDKMAVLGISPAVVTLDQFIDAGFEVI